MTVTCKLLGGLGNNLFQIATTIAYALKHKIDYCIPTHIDSPHEPEQKVFQSDKLNYCGGTFNGISCFHNEKSFTYSEIRKSDCNNFILNGYFQSYKYFQDYRPEILTLLNIPKAIAYGRVFLHIRLGDYKTLGKFHKIVSTEYINAALQLFYDKGHRDIMVFSDDHEGAKDILLRAWGPGNGKLYGGLNFEFSEGKTPLQDLSLMAACAGGIMSASSFSWWGAWLGNQNRTIIYPKDWFGPELAHDIKDLCPSNWIAL